MNELVHHIISGTEDGKRIDSRILEERIQSAVKQGHRHLQINALGQHGIGGRIWRSGGEPVQVRISGHAGQRVGSMGFPGTTINVLGPASDDVGWLNAGAEIVVYGHAANGTGNAMSQGKIYVAGNIGSRGMTMTKHNPRFAPPELWVLGSAGDYFGEFMAGGIAVICGHAPQNEHNVLGHRPLIGMVGGRVYFRGPHSGFSQRDAVLEAISETDWQWLTTNLKTFLQRINREDLLQHLTDRQSWQLLRARTPHEKSGPRRRSMAAFRSEVWNKELGLGGLIGDLSNLDHSPIPLVVTDHLRRFVPVWENKRYAAPCEATCPTGIPVQERWQLVRDGRVDEAIDLALSYTPFPATVCGYLCPNLCMQSCTRQIQHMPSVDITRLGKASLDAKLPQLPPLSGQRIAVIGGGPAGLSVAWQLRRAGHETVVYDMARELGGKITTSIPGSRLPGEVISTELARVQEVIPHVHLQQRLDQEDIQQMLADYGFLVIATGAQKPRTLSVPGNERMIPALTFLIQAKHSAQELAVGREVVIIGAGNVGCDAATEAYRLGADKVTLIDIQEPASFGKEREAAEAAGADFLWPVITREVTAEGVVLTDGRILKADTVIVAIGDVPDLDFLPDEVTTQNGFIEVDAYFQTKAPKIFAIGDAVKPGLLTDAIGSGRKAAQAIEEIIAGRHPDDRTQLQERQMIVKERVHLEYFDPRITTFQDVEHCGSQCASCGACRDCGTCVAICPRAAISRVADPDNDFIYQVDPTRCIGCGFCAGACPCGIWDLVENEPLDG